MGGAAALVNRVVKGGNREVEVVVDLVCLYPDQQFKYEIQAVGKVTIPYGDPIPTFVVRGLPQSFLAGSLPEPIAPRVNEFPMSEHVGRGGPPDSQSHSVNPDVPAPAPEPGRPYVPPFAVKGPSPFAGLPPGNYQIVAHTVCRDPDGVVRWHEDTEAVPFVIHAQPETSPEEDSGH